MGVLEKKEFKVVIMPSQSSAGFEDKTWIGDNVRPILNMEVGAKENEIWTATKEKNSFRLIKKIGSR